MNRKSTTRTKLQTIAMTLLAAVPLVAIAQSPVDDNGKVIGAYEPALENPNTDLVVGNEYKPNWLYENVSGSF